jgi:ATP-binding cassette, subfamily C (CFTR/MRP), member 1
MLTSSIISAVVSVSRVSKFLESAELQPDARTYVLPRPSDSAAGSDRETSSGTSPCPLSRDDMVLSIRNGEFRWARDSIQSILEDINVDVKMGKLIGVYGRVGAGKVCHIGLIYLESRFNRDFLPFSISCRARLILCVTCVLGYPSLACSTPSLARW